MNTFSELWRKLRGSKKYREHFVEAQVKQAIPYQIRALMKAKALTQTELAERSGLTQGAVSRAANPKYGNLSLNTLVRIAAGFDVAFVGRFVPFSELGRWLDHLHEESTSVSTFTEENERLLTMPADDTAQSAGRVKSLPTLPKRPIKVEVEDSRRDAGMQRDDTTKKAAYAGA